ncbi:hypothetical protein IL306_004749 [Fusarium sp. DS 682]|nr:hypothetical protein IL306_004749 [Fusarium sp. DS 682]
MSLALDKRIHIWLGNIQESTDDPSPIPDPPPYDDFQCNPKKRRRPDSPLRDTRQTLQLRPDGPERSNKNLCSYGSPHLHAIFGAVETTSYRQPKKRATIKNHVYSTSQTINYTPAVMLPEIKVEPMSQVSLHTLLTRIEDICAGCNILPTSARNLMNATCAMPMYKQDWGWAAHGLTSDIHYSDERRDFGAEPRPTCVQRILHQAAFCAEACAPVSDWNIEVVQKILEVSLREENGSGSQLVDFRSSTNSTVMLDYCKEHAMSQRPIDFSVYIEPNLDTNPRIPHIIEALQKKLPKGMFNHMNLTTLAQRPVAFHIRTFKQSNLPAVQEDIWFPARWEFLQRLLRMRYDAMRTLAKWIQQMPDEPLYRNLLAGSQLSLPEFLPGVVVKGHEWYLVISEPKRHRFSREILIGETTCPMGVYKIVNALQVLQHWAANEYWEWMRRLLLDWPCRPSLNNE